MTKSQEGFASSTTMELNGEAAAKRRAGFSGSPRKLPAGVFLRPPLFSEDQEDEIDERACPPKMPPGWPGVVNRGRCPDQTKKDTVPHGSTSSGAEDPRQAEPSPSSKFRSKAEKDGVHSPAPMSVSAIHESLQNALAANDWGRLYADLKELANRADRGDAEALQIVVKTLDEHPVVWQTLGNLANIAESTLIAAISDGARLLSESTRRQIAAMRAEMLGAHATQIEKMAVQRVCMAWLAMQHIDFLCASSDPQGAHANALAKRQELAEKRYQITLKSLKLTREMAGRPVRQAPAAATASSPQCNQTAAEPLAPKTKRRTAAKKAASATTTQEPIACEETSNCRPSGRPSQRAPQIAGKPANRVAPHFETTKSGKTKRNGSAKLVAS